MFDGHNDTYGIRYPGPSAIPLVSDTIRTRAYHAGMAKRHPPEWGVRLRRHIKAGERTMAEIARLMDMTEAGLRHWLNGTREINLSEFEELCAIAEADPCMILAGRPALTSKQWDALRSLSTIR